jgi:hypothetical protein
VSTTRNPAPRHDDRGAAMIMTMLVLVLLVAMSVTATMLAIGNLRGAGSAQRAGAALDAAEAGVAQAVSFIRAKGTRTLRCPTPAPACTNPWNPGYPVTATVASGGRWEAITFLVRSTGTAAGFAQRILEVEVDVASVGLPPTIFARTVNLGGTVTGDQISIVSTGCVYRRDKISFTGALDPTFGIPPAVHSSQVITASQGSGQHCPNTAKPIHSAGSPCHATYRYDQDRFGGPLLGTACQEALAYPIYQETHPDGTPRTGVRGSYVAGDGALAEAFGVKQPALSDAVLEQLRTAAQEQGNYYTTTSYTLPTEAHSVLFFDLAGGQVDLRPLGSSIFARGPLQAGDPSCLDRSLMIVIVGGDAKLNSNAQIAASIYLASGAPYGRVSKAAGTASHIGLIYGDTLDLTGTFSAALDSCYTANPPPALFEVTPGGYRELDR